MQTMNTILAKAAQELAKDTPDIAYVRGMLETLLAMNETTSPAPVVQPSVAFTKLVPVIDGLPPTPPIDIIKQMAAASLE
jgi:hypothetical protein